MSEGVCDGFPACVSPSNTLALFFFSFFFFSLLGHSAAVWSPTVQEPQSERSLTPSRVPLPRARRRSPRTLDGASRALRLVVYAWVLPLFVLITSQRMSTPKTSSLLLPSYLPPFGFALSDALAGGWLVRATHAELPCGRSCSVPSKGTPSCELVGGGVGVRG